MPHDRTDIQASLLTLQILVAALVTGIVTFGMVAWFVPPQSMQNVSIELLRMICVGMLLVVAPLGLVWRSRMRRSVEARVNDEVPDPDLFGSFFISTLVPCALLEGVALFGVVVHLLSGHPVDLLIAATPAALMVLLYFPTRSRWEMFIERARGRRILER